MRKERNRAARDPWSIDALEQSLDFAAIEILDRYLPSAPLERHADDPLQVPKLLGMLSGEIARKDVERSEPGVTGGDRVLSVGFKGGKNRDDTLIGEIRYRQTVPRCGVARVQ